MFCRCLFLRSRSFLIHLTYVALIAALLQPVMATSAALGEASVRSALGQRLDAELEIASLSATEAASVAVRLAPAESWTSAGIDLAAIHRSLHLWVERREGRSVVRISSDQLVSEPFLHLLVELSADGVRTIRQYVLLIDPPTSITAPHTAAGASDRAGEDSAADRTQHSTYAVKRGETLHSIARQLQPEDVQLEQVMVALLSQNPDAFIGNNVHRLRSGSQLTIPAVADIRSIPTERARQTVRLQTADFLRYQRQLAELSAAGVSSAVAATPSATAANVQTSSGSVTVKVAEPAPPPVTQDKLTLSASGGKEEVGSNPSTQQAIESVAADKALADANARVATLEKNIGEMQALLQTKNRALAEAQQRAEQVPKPNALLEPDIILPPIDPALAAAGLVALLLLVLLWRRQRNKQARGEDRVAPAIEPTLAQTVIGAAGGRQIDTAHSVFHSNFVPSVSQIDTNEVDAVAEADVYIAYGRSEQAEEILLDALRAHPERHALRVKLLEIYAARNDRQRFGTLAAELRVLTHGQGADWARAAQLGQSLEPENYLYDAPVRGAVTESVAEVEFPTATNTIRL